MEWGFQELLALGLGIALIFAAVPIIIVVLFRIGIEDTNWSVLMRLLVDSLFRMGYRRELIYEILEIYC